MSVKFGEDMRIVMLAIGTLGDVSPYIALGLGLQRAGHQVCLATHYTFRKHVTSRGLDFAPIEGNPQQWTTGGEIQTLVAGGRNFFRWVRQFGRLVRPFIERVLVDCWEACQGAEAIIYSPWGAAGYSIAERLDVPVYAAFLQPASRTRAFPTAWLPPGPDLGGTYHWLTHLVVEQIFWQTFRQPMNRWRQEILNLPPMPLTGPFGRPVWKQQPFLYGYSSHVLPRPSDWPDRVHVTGYWFLDRARDWRPPKELTDFLAAGPLPVYIGFGSIPDPCPEALTELVLEALARAGQRGILQAGWGGLGSSRLPDGVLQIEWVSHDWLFPQMAAVVHHGGAGTTATGLRAGVPAIIIPFAWDQPFWGQRVAEIGVGPAPIPRQKLSAQRLAAAIHTAVNDEGMRARAAALGRQIGAEDGVAQAVEAFQNHLSRQ